MAVQPDSRDRDRYLAEIGWADEVVATIGPYELVQQPARVGIWYLIDTRRPRSRENRYRVERKNHEGWVVDDAQPGGWFPGLDQMPDAVKAWVALHP